LYCGAGTFSGPLSKLFRKLVATEISKTSVNAAQDNIQMNDIHNLVIARLSSEEFVEAYTKVRAFNRLANIDLDDYDFTTVLVDPPRAGLDETTLDLIARFNTIIYISCNPNTLKRDLDALNLTHQATKVALFDQFPFTHHMESGVILQKRQLD
jgi:tRNA (uracil-5-)-methyltransferase